MTEQPDTAMPTADPGPSVKKLETIVSLSKRRGFVYPCGEIYGGTRSAWDYGPLGVELKNNVKARWWNAMVRERDDVEAVMTRGDGSGQAACARTDDQDVAGNVLPRAACAPWSAPRGGRTTCQVDLAEVFRLLVAESASGAIFIHNHPSGDPEPSPEDLELTQRLVDAGSLLEIRILDHLIVGRGRYTSLRDARLWPTTTVKSTSYVRRHR